MSGNRFLIQTKEEHSPNAGFFSWVRSNSAFFITQVAAIGSFLLYLGTFFYYVFGRQLSAGTSDLEQYLISVKQLLFVLNVLFCAIFILVSLRILNHDEENKDTLKRFYYNVFAGQLEDKAIKRAKKDLRGFKKIFLWYWIYALSFYLFLLLLPAKTAADKLPKVSWNDSDYISYVIGNTMILIVYLLSRKMVLSNQGKYGDPQKKEKTNILLHPLAPIVLYILLGIFPILYQILKIKRFDVTEWFQFINLLSGTIKMIVLSVFISRLDSKLIGLPSGLVSILYIYAAIQPLEITLPENDIISQSINVTQYAIAFILKIYFFLILIYIMQTGRMMNFFCCHGKLADSLRESRKGKHDSTHEN